MSVQVGRDDSFLWVDTDSNRKSMEKPPTASIQTAAIKSNGGKKRDREESSKKNEKEESEQGVHIWTERERRKKMRNMFSSLHALLPQLPPKVDKSSIVDEAVSYIKTLQQTLEDLNQRKKQNLQQQLQQQQLPPEAIISDSIIISDPIINYNDGEKGIIGGLGSAVGFQTWTSSNVVLNVCGEEAQISVCSPQGMRIGGEGVFTAVCAVLERHGIEVVTAQVFCNAGRRLVMIHARHRRDNGVVVEGFPETMATTAEEIYKQAANEIVCYLSSP